MKERKKDPKGWLFGAHTSSELETTALQARDIGDSVDLQVEEGGRVALGGLTNVGS
jgi:hypothetical protein